MEHGLESRTFWRTEDIWQEILNRTMLMYRYVQAQVDALAEDEFWVQKIDAQGNRLVEPHKWIQYERVLMEDLREVVAKMDGLDLEARRVAVEEAEAALIAKFMDSILEDLKLTKAQKERLDDAIDRALPIITGQAREIAA
jgi:hypothetical protein